MTCRSEPSCSLDQRRPCATMTDMVTLRMTAAASAALMVSLLAAGCGSGDDAGDTATSAEAAATTSAPAAAAGEGSVAPGEEESATSSATGASMAATGDACSLLSDENVEAIASGPATPQQISAPGETYSIDACTWSDPEIGPLIALQVITPGAIADPFAILLGASGESPTPYPSLPDGQTWNLGFLPGGGGQGYTVTWTADGQQVALSALGDPITDEVKQAVNSAAEDVNSELGG